MPPTHTPRQTGSLALQIATLFGGALLLAVAMQLVSAWAATSCFPIGGGSCVRVAIPAGDDPAAECQVGELFLDLNSSADTNCTTGASNTLCCCTAPNTWTECAN